MEDINNSRSSARSIEVQFISVLADLNYRLANLPKRAQAIKALYSFIDPEGLGEIADPLKLYHILQSIERYEHPNMKDVSQALNRSRAATTRIVDRLVAEGYVERFDDTIDRRVKRLSLTKAGQSVLDVMNQQVITRLKPLFAILTKEEKSTVLKILAKLAYS